MPVPRSGVPFDFATLIPRVGPLGRHGEALMPFLRSVSLPNKSREKSRALKENLAPCENLAELFVFMAETHFSDRSG